MTTETVKSNWPPASRDPNMVIADEWGDYRKGDPVRIVGDRTGRYKFVSHTRYPNGSEGVVVYGGVGQHRLMREVGVDAIQHDGPAGGETPEKPADAEQSGPTTVDPPGDLKQAREALKVSRKDLATRAGVSESAVATLERGGNPRGADETRRKIWQALHEMGAVTDPSLHDVAAAEKLGVSVEALRDGAIPIPAEWNDEADEEEL